MILDHIEKKQRLAPTSITLEKGQGLVVTGQNGSGKTTLLDIIAGFTHPTSGTLQKTQTKRIGYLPQAPPRTFQYTVSEYLSIGNSTTKYPLLSALFELTALLDKDVVRLSTGQWQRVSIARLLMSESEILLLDEPDAPLDDTWAAVIADALTRELTRGAIIIATTHRPTLQNMTRFRHLNLTRSQNT